MGAALVALTVASPGSTLRIEYRDVRLRNGLRVILSEDHSAPVFAIAVGYNVGSRDERKGWTGLAHLFEHMMFKGSANVAAGEHPYLMVMYGGSMNATTNKDRTMYYEILPSNQLDLALFLEADRMRSLDITQANIDNQRSAVQEERRLALDNQPYGRTAEALDELAYDNFAYQHPVIGTMADIGAATKDDVAGFFKTYYAPNNAAVAIVGDVGTGATLEKVRRYFESIPPQPAPPVVDMTEPEQTGERKVTIADPLARAARLDIAYKVPASLSQDRVALDVLGTRPLSSVRKTALFDCCLTHPTRPRSSHGLPGAEAPDRASVIHDQRVLGLSLNGARDVLSVLRAEDERAQNEQIERSLEQRDPLMVGRASVLSGRHPT